MKTHVAAEAAEVMTSRAAQAAVNRKRTAAQRARTAPGLDRQRIYVVLAALWLGLVVTAAAVGVAIIQFRNDEEPPARTATDAPVAVTPQGLKAFADSHGAPVYWAGGLRSRRLELTTTRSGTFVRYLPAGVSAGDPSTTFTTIATYPLRNAYATAAGRRTQPGMASRQTPHGGLAVWNREKPTSVYVAFPRVPHLVEVYAERGRDARDLALSGRLRPVG